MKVLRIDNQGVLNNAVFKNLEDLRQQLCDYHSIDWRGVDKNNNDIDIFTLTLEQIMDYGEWNYEWITEEEAEQYEDKRY